MSQENSFTSKPKLASLSNAELGIMDLAWDKGEITIWHALQHVNSQRAEPLQRATVQVQMQRLEAKGWLTHREERNTFIFRPTRPREETIPSILEDMVSRVFKGSCTGLVRCLFEHRKISKTEIEQLRQLIREAERNKQ
jgi:predicted transcriptional regulator